MNLRRRVTERCPYADSESGRIGVQQITLRVGSGVPRLVCESGPNRLAQCSGARIHPRQHQLVMT